MEETAQLSPMMLQWKACKEKAAGALLLFRLGDFFEAFYEDAKLLAKELDVTLTKRQTIPMSGIPAHTSEGYIDRLVSKGYRVAIAEQVEDAKLAKGLVKRDIVRIVTPGTLINSSLLVEKTNNFLASIVHLNKAFGLAVLDVTTAEFQVLELESFHELLSELERLAPSELLLSQKSYSLFENKQAYHFHIKEEWFFDYRTALDKLLKHFRVHSLDGFGLKGLNAAINAAGTLLYYVSDELNLSISHIVHLQKEVLANYMSIDATTKHHLELSSLLQHLDQTLTPMGSRLLKKWVYHPLLSPVEIDKRRAAIACLLDHLPLTERATTHLQEIRDLERLIMRIETGYASPRDLFSLRLSLEELLPLSLLLQSIDHPLLTQDREALTSVTEITRHIKTALIDAPPLRLSDGGIFNKGYHQELDALITIKENHHSWIAHYQTALRESTQIKTLKVSYTQAFGYFIEVSRAQAKNMPEEFHKRQTLVNTERFTTKELKDYEDQLLSAEEGIKALENQLFDRLKESIIQKAETIRSVAHTVAHIDALCALALIAHKYHYVSPLVDEGHQLLIQEGRHPVIEALPLQERFIPNDLTLDAQERLLLITGPNMAGKSTYIRQVALIVIMAQMGSYVPASAAHIGIIDKLFSRIGASDDLSKGQSTFMVEMAETANILHNMSARSLIILDEIGRGTSTYDGISIAWAVAEFLLTQKNKPCKTLFATHYWELTHMEEKIAGAVNYHVSVHEQEGKIVFLHKIVKGSTDRSYGIHVAKLAGLPLSVIQRAEKMLLTLEKKPTKPVKEEQLDLFSLPLQTEIISKELKALDPNQVTPLEALEKLIRWKAYVSRQ